MGDMFRLIRGCGFDSSIPKLSRHLLRLPLLQDFLWEVFARPLHQQ